MSRRWASLIIVLLCFRLAIAASGSAAEGGWYLLLPPLSDYDDTKGFLRGYQILEGEPLSKWRHHSSWDDAQSCEAVKNSQTQMAHDVYGKASDGYQRMLGAAKVDPQALKMQRWITERENAQVDQWLASRCIQSSDPRLR